MARGNFIRDMQPCLRASSGFEHIVHRTAVRVEMTRQHLLKADSVERALLRQGNAVRRPR